MLEKMRRRMISVTYVCMYCGMVLYRTGNVSVPILAVQIGYRKVMVF